MPRLLLGGVKFGIAGDPTIQANQVAPQYGQKVVASITLANTGGASASFTLTGIAVQSGTRNKQGNLWADPTNTNPTVSGTLGPGQQTTVKMYSGPAAYAEDLGGVEYLDHIYTLTVNGQATEYLVPQCVKTPHRPNVQIVGVSYSVA